MFSPIEISYYKSQLESQRNKMTQEHWDTMKYYPNHCTPLIESIYNLKSELIKQIIEESGWDYDGKHFIYKSNYRFYRIHNDIVFNVNKVAISYQGYYPESNNQNQYEMSFISKYKDVLKEISIYERTLKELSDLYVKKNNKKGTTNNNQVLNSQKIYQEIKSNLEPKAKEFEEKHSKEDFLTMVNLLNIVSEAEDKIEVYEEKRKSLMNKELENDILFWISIYVNGGDKLLAKFYNNDSKKEKEFVYKKS